MAKFSLAAYAAYRAEFVRRSQMSVYERANDRAAQIKAQRRAVCFQRGRWWLHVDWLAWLDERSTETRPTENIAMIVLSKEWRRRMEDLERQALVNALRFAYDQRHAWPLANILGERGAKLVFIEVGHKGSGKYRSVEVAA